MIVNEIFHSLQGESTTAGLPTVFVRLTGCPLRCRYCDTAYAFSGGENLEIEQILETVAAYACRHVTITGGEPLAQNGCRTLLQRLVDAGYRVSLETSGALDIGDIAPAVVRVMDLKTPGSGEVARNRYQNLALLRPHDELKFVISHRQDYDWAREQIRLHGLLGRCEILFSPAHGQIAPTELAEWILQDRLEVRFQLQLHKILWGDQPGH